MLCILRMISQDGWLCAHCKELTPIFRHYDARYCPERCRKAATGCVAARGARGTDTRAGALWSVRPSAARLRAYVRLDDQP